MVKGVGEGKTETVMLVSSVLYNDTDYYVENINTGKIQKPVCIHFKSIYSNTR